MAVSWVHAAGMAGLVAAAPGLAATPAASPADAILAWMRAHGVARLCATVEVRDKNPDTAWLVGSSGDSAVDAHIRDVVRQAGTTWNGVEGQVFARYQTSPQRVPLVFNLDPSTDPEAAQGTMLGCRGAGG